MIPHAFSRTLRAGLIGMTEMTHFSLKPFSSLLLSDTGI